LVYISSSSSSVYYHPLTIIIEINILRHLFTRWGRERFDCMEDRRAISDVHSQEPPSGLATAASARVGYRPHLPPGGGGEVAGRLFPPWIRQVCLPYFNNTYHILSINRPTKCGKEKSPSDGHCQCEKEMDDHLLACQQTSFKNLLTRQ
jgi:hypothetical protein